MADNDTYGKPPTLAELLRRTQPGPGGCLLWTGAHTPRGYPVVKVDGREVYVHREVYRLSHGKLAPGAVVDQTCNHPACIKPGHLVAKTQAANMQRAGKAGRLASS
jgi:hypothetical protein